MKTMPVMLAVFFAMLFCAGLAIGQTVNPETDVIEQQPPWCHTRCINMPVKVQGEGAMQVVEDASRRNAVVIDNLNFTKMRSLQGDEFSVDTVIHVGDVWFMTVEDAFSPPDWPKVKEILQSEYKRRSDSVASVNTKSNLAPINGLNNSAPTTMYGTAVQAPPASNPVPAEFGSVPQGAAKQQNNGTDTSEVKKTDGKFVIYCGDKRFAPVCKEYLKIAYGLDSGQADRPSVQGNTALIRNVILISALSVFTNLLITFHKAIKAIIYKFCASWRARRTAKASAFLTLLDSANAPPAQPNLRVMPTPPAQSPGDSGVNVPQPVRIPKPRKPYIPLCGMKLEKVNYTLSPPEIVTPTQTDTAPEPFEWWKLEVALRRRLSQLCGGFLLEKEQTFEPSGQGDEAYLVSCPNQYQNEFPGCIRDALRGLGQKLAYAMVTYGTLGAERHLVYRVGRPGIGQELPKSEVPEVSVVTATQVPVVTPAAAVL